MNSGDLPTNRRILVIDDNASIHADFRKILCPDVSRKASLNKMRAALFDAEATIVTAAGFEMDSAHQGQDGFEMVKKAIAEGRPYAMAFVDVRMPPGWDGVETIARIWEVNPELQIVVCTAYSDYSWEEMRAKVGQPDGLLVLKKPFDNIEVQQLAHALTKKWSLNFQSRSHMAELAKANDSLRCSEERFSKAFHESPLPTGIQALADQRFLDVNQRLAQIAGCTRKEMIGRTPAELFLWEKPEQADLWYQMIGQDKLVRDQEANIRDQSGALHEVLVSLAPIALGDQLHLLLLAQDVSERALLERQLRQAQKMEAIGQLAAGVAHDFNNILTVIQGQAGILKQKLNGHAATKPLEDITTAAARAGTLIRQLLMFSRKQTMQFRHLDLNQTLATTINMLERLVGEHVEIVFTPHSPLPSIHADTSMLEQIFLNLAVNARDAMPNGGKIVLTTSVESINRTGTESDPEHRQGQFVCFTFRDNGMGMEPRILTRIFEPFFTTKAPGNGTGLGLSTVFGVVRQHRGWIEVDSKPHEGTTFRVFFPASSQAPEHNERPTDSSSPTGSETVLVAEDEDLLREMVVQALKIHGYKVLEASSGRDALEVWEKARQPIDLLFTDMVMHGGILGGELAERLVEKCPTLKVIYTSGYSPGMAGKDVSLLEGRNFLPKPYSIGKLTRFVRECLDSPLKRN